MSLRIRRAIIWWLTPNAVHVMQGSQGGGDVHLAIGWVEKEVRALFRGTSVRKQHQASGASAAYIVPVYDDLSRTLTEVPLRVMAAHLRRGGEVQLASQSPGSRTAIPVWERQVRTSVGTLPRQAAMIAYCADNRFRAFVLMDHEAKSLLGGDYEEFDRARKQARPRAGCTFLEREFRLPMRQLPETRRKKAVRNLGTTLADLENMLKATSRARKQSVIRKWERRSKVRKLALRAFGPACMVVGCKCTERLSASQLAQVAECHHIEAVAKQGDDSLHNLLILCPTHHAVFHRCDHQFSWSTPTKGILRLDDSTKFTIERYFKL